jgi:cysteine synthase A
MTSTLTSQTSQQQALEDQFGLADRVVNPEVLANSVQRFRERGITLPTFEELSNPPKYIAKDKAGDADPQGPQPVARPRGAHRSSPGSTRPIIVVFGDRFPMIDAHKVLAAYACLVARLVTGQFDPTRHRAIWPSTGNYARGGVAISRIMASRGVAVLPENMSQERFDWLDAGSPTRRRHPHPGSESNVKEIYDACAELEADPTNFMLNQFCEFANYLVHRHVTGARARRTCSRPSPRRQGPDGRDLRLAAWVSATGSAGTIAAGDHLKVVYGTKIVAVEALECPTMLYNGFGEHNIQGIGDKHIPLIHNVTNTDVVVGDQRPGDRRAG